jgi:hypothetical protein
MWTQLDTGLGTRIAVNYFTLAVSGLGLGCVKTFWAVAELGETHLNHAEIGSI